jgi:hypothetical protein
MIAHLQDGEFNGERILQPALPDRCTRLLYSPDPRMDGMAYGFFYNHNHGQLVLSHGGDTILFHTAVSVTSGKYRSFHLHQQQYGNKVVEAAYDAFMAHYFRLKLPNRLQR